MIRVEKRLPYGLMIEWGTVYKPCEYEEVDGGVEYNKKRYVAMDMPVQFRNANQVKASKMKSRQQIATDFTASQQEDKLETTDAYYDHIEEDYKCVVAIGDLVLLGKEYWLVRDITESDLFMPRKHTIYILSVQEVAREMVNVKE